MLKSFRLALLTSLTIAAATLPAIAQENLDQENFFDPKDNCTTVLEGDTDAAANWAFGYLAREIQRARATDPDMIDDFLGDFTAACNRNADASFVSILNGLIGIDEVQDASKDAVETQPVDPDARQALLDMFEDPDLDLVAVLRNLAPTDDEIHLVFPENLASSLSKQYVEAFGPDLDRAGFPQSPAVITSTFTTTFELKTHPLLDELRGGYKDIVDLYLVDVPFAEIVLTYPEINDSVNLDGLLYIENRWTIMPRPWRGL